MSASLGDLDEWKALRPRGGSAQVTAGPFTEAKEVVGGLFIVEAESPEAPRIASSTRRRPWGKKADGMSN